MGVVVLIGVVEGSGVFVPGTVLLGAGQEVPVGTLVGGFGLGISIRGVAVDAGELKEGPIPFQRITVKNKRTAKSAIHFNPKFFKIFLFKNIFSIRQSDYSDQG
jgi:hypothetical protein